MADQGGDAVTPDKTGDTLANSSGQSGNPAQRGLRHPLSWVSSTYFAEGFPYTIVNQLPEVLFKELGASLQAIGLTALFHLPWNLKFLWGPFLDAYGTKRKWLIGIELLLIALTTAIAFVTSTDSVLLIASVLFLIMAVLSATHDIAIDGYYLEALNEEEQSKYVGWRATAYRIAMLVISGPTVYVIGLYGWTAALLVASAITALLCVYHWLFLPYAEVESRPISALFAMIVRPMSIAVVGALVVGALAGRTLLTSEFWTSFMKTWPVALQKLSTESWIALSLLAMLVAGLACLPAAKRWVETSERPYAAAFVAFLDQPKIGYILAFVVLFRTGDSFLLKMRYAFMRSIHITPEEYGVLSGTIGIVASFAATIWAGRMISQQGLKKWIWPFVLGQNALNLLYAWLAHYYLPLWSDPSASQAVLNELIVAAVLVVESAGSGLGTAVFMVVLMRCCLPNHRAAHMAILTALMSVSFTIAGVASGFLASALGFDVYFGFTFLATIPAMALIFVLPNLDAKPRTPDRR